jgi:hypothetical protein
LVGSLSVLTKIVSGPPFPTRQLPESYQTITAMSSAETFFLLFSSPSVSHAHGDEPIPIPE